MSKLFEKLDEQAANKTPEKIREFYDDMFCPTEHYMRSMLRQYFSRNLIDTSEEYPLYTDIVFSYDGMFGLSSLEMPRIVEMFQDSEGIIWCREEGVGSCCELDFYSIHELMQIMDGFKEYEK